MATTIRELSARPRTAITSRTSAINKDLSRSDKKDSDISSCDVIAPTGNNSPYRLRLTKSNVANYDPETRSRPATPSVVSTSQQSQRRAVTGAAIGHPRSRDTVFPTTIVNSIMKERKVNEVELQFVAGFVNVVKPPITNTITGQSKNQPVRRPKTVPNPVRSSSPRPEQDRTSTRPTSTLPVSARLPIVIINKRHQSRDYSYDYRVTCNTPDLQFTDWLANHPATESRTTAHSALSGSLQSLDNCNQAIYHLYEPQVNQRQSSFPLTLQPVNSDIISNLFYRQYTDIPGSTSHTSRIRRLLPSSGQCFTASNRSHTRLRRPQLQGKGIRFMGKFLGAKAPLKSAANREGDMVSSRCPFICVNKSVSLLLR